MPRGARLMLALVLPLSVAGCSLDAERRDVVAGQDDGLVIEASGDGSEYRWGVQLKVRSAEPGVWFLFESSLRPKSLAAVRSFAGAAGCRPGDCPVPELGELAAMEKLETKGPLYIGAWYLQERTKDRYFTLVREGGSDPPAPITVDVLVQLGHCDGCMTTPDPAAVHAIEVPR